MPTGSGLNISITQNEVAILKNVLERIPQSLLIREIDEPNLEFSVSVVANPPVPIYNPTRDLGARAESSEYPHGATLLPH